MSDAPSAICAGLGSRARSQTGLKASSPTSLSDQQMAVGQNQWYHFGAPILVYFSGDWGVHWGYGILTHGQIINGQLYVQIRATNKLILSPFDVLLKRPETATPWRETTSLAFQCLSQQVTGIIIASCLGPPVVPFYPFLGETSPY